MYDGIEQLENDLWEEDGETTESTWTMSGVEWEDASEEDMGHAGISESRENSRDDMNDAREPMHREDTSVLAESSSERFANMDVDEGECENIWSPFKILTSVPADHAFYVSPPARPSKSFLARLRKEYSVLDNSLPGQCITPLDEPSLIKFSRHNPRSCI